MNISSSNENGRVTITLEGWLDTASSPQLGDEVNSIESAEEIVLDFEKVEYIASAGLRQIVACHRKAKELNASFAVVNVGRDTMNIFKMTGLDKKLSVSGKE